MLKDVLREVYSYIVEKPMKLREWVPLKELSWVGLSQNPAAIHLLEENLDKVSWSSLSRNPAAIHILEQNLDKVNCPGSVPGYE